MPSPDLLADLGGRLPRHARLIDALARVVRADRRFRWLELGCSLGAGEGDEHSDVDMAVGYVDIEGPDGLDADARSLSSTIGDPIEVLVHRMDRWPDDVCRLAAEYSNGVQLDLVFMPAALRRGLPDRAVAIVDKDGVLDAPWVPDSREPPTEQLAREWLVLGWWALSDTAKYIARGSWLEAVESIAEARRQALRLHAAGAGIPYPGFGLTSLLDFPPFDVPAGLADTYPSPTDPSAVIDAAWSVARLLDDASDMVADRLGRPLTTRLADAVRLRLERPRREA